MSIPMLANTSYQKLAKTKSIGDHHTTNQYQSKALKYSISWDLPLVTQLHLKYTTEIVMQSQTK